MYKGLPSTSAREVGIVLVLIHLLLLLLLLLIALGVILVGGGIMVCYRLK